MRNELIQEANQYNVLLGISSYDFLQLWYDREQNIRTPDKDGKIFLKDHCDVEISYHGNMINKVKYHKYYGEAEEKMFLSELSRLDEEYQERGGRGINKACLQTYGKPFEEFYPIMGERQIEWDITCNPQIVVYITEDCERKYHIEVSYTQDYIKKSEPPQWLDPYGYAKRYLIENKDFEEARESEVQVAVLPGKSGKQNMVEYTWRFMQEKEYNQALIEITREYVLYLRQGREADRFSGAGEVESKLKRTLGVDVLKEEATEYQRKESQLEIEVDEILPYLRCRAVRWKRTFEGEIKVCYKRSI